MSTATPATEAGAVKNPTGRKRGWIALGSLLLVAVAAGLYWQQKSQQDAAGQAAVSTLIGAAGGAAPGAREGKAAPSFVAMDAFTVNLTDRQAERYAQIGLTLELAQPSDQERVRNFMPVIRNNVLMVLSNKSSQELLDRDGKARLAQEIRREAARAMGLDDAAQPGVAANAATRQNPVAAVHFSNFIVQ